jgi:DNA-binding GntR family transcriptional regulator
MPSPAPAKKQTRATELAEVVRQAILDGSLPPGAKVGLDQLRRRYGVSLSPLREATSRLVATRLLEVEDQRGYRIADLSHANLDEVIALRAALEPEALASSIAQGDLEWEGRLVQALHRLKAANAAPAFRSAHADLYRAALAACPGPITRSLCQTHFDLCARYLTLLAPHAPDPATMTQDWAGIVAAALDRDTGQARALLLRHLNRTACALRTAFPDPSDIPHKPADDAR